MKNTEAIRMRFSRHGGIYRSDVLFLHISLDRSTAFRSGSAQALRTHRKLPRPTHRRDEFRPAIPQRVARQHCPSPLHRHHQLKTIAPLNGIFYHRTVTYLLTGCLRHGDKLKAVRQGCEAISELGGAKPGDRTMLDALDPFVKGLKDGLGAAVEAAERGVDATAGMRPRLGRSSYLGDRVLGHVDPGAKAVAIWLRAVSEVLGFPGG